MLTNAYHVLPTIQAMIWEQADLEISRIDSSQLMQRNSLLLFVAVTNFQSSSNVDLTCRNENITIWCICGSPENIYDF